MDYSPLSTTVVAVSKSNNVRVKAYLRVDLKYRRCRDVILTSNKTRFSDY